MTQIQRPTAVRVMVAVMDLMIRKGLEDTKLLFMRYSYRMVFDLLVSLNVYMSHKIETMVDDPIDPAKR